MTNPSSTDAASVRPLRPDDAEAVFELFAAAEQHDLGEVLVELADIESEWSQPSFDLAEQTLGMWDGVQLVAATSLHRNRMDGTVHPDHRRRGYGTRLVTWSVDRAEALGYPRIGQTMPTSNTGAIDLFRRRGFEILYTSWILELPEGAAISPTALPPGHHLATAEREPRIREAFQTIEDAFNEWPNRPPSTYEDWRSFTVDRADFEPWQLILAVEEGDAADSVVGACAVSATGGDGWVNQIAVRREARGRGLGRALLVAAFEAARLHGARTARLSTDSRTGALDLYLHAGMRVASSFEHWALDLS